MTLWDKTKTETKTSGAEKRSAVARARKGSRRGLTSKMHEKKSLGLRNVLYLGCIVDIKLYIFIKTFFKLYSLKNDFTYLPINLLSKQFLKEKKDIFQINKIEGNWSPADHHITRILKENLQTERK